MLNTVHTYMHVCALGGAVLAVALLARQTPCRKPLLGNGPRNKAICWRAGSRLSGQSGRHMCRFRHPRPLPGGLLVLATRSAPTGPRLSRACQRPITWPTTSPSSSRPPSPLGPVRRRDALHSRRRRAEVHLITARRTDLLLLTSAKRITKERDAGAMPSTAPEFVAVVPERTPRLVVTRVRGAVASHADCPPIDGDTRRDDVGTQGLAARRVLELALESRGDRVGNGQDVDASRPFLPAKVSAGRGSLLHLRYKQPPFLNVCAGQHGSVSQYYDL